MDDRIEALEREIAEISHRDRAELERELSVGAASSSTNVPAKTSAQLESPNDVTQLSPALLRGRRSWLSPRSLGNVLAAKDAHGHRRARSRRRIEPSELKPMSPINMHFSTIQLGLPDEYFHTLAIAVTGLREECEAVAGVSSVQGQAMVLLRNRVRGFHQRCAGTLSNMERLLTYLADRAARAAREATEQHLVCCWDRWIQHAVLARQRRAISSHRDERELAMQCWKTHAQKLAVARRALLHMAHVDTARVWRAWQEVISLSKQHLELLRRCIGQLVHCNTARALRQWGARIGLATACRVVAQRCVTSLVMRATAHAFRGWAQAARDISSKHSMMQSCLQRLLNSSLMHAHAAWARHTATVKLQQDTLRHCMLRLVHRGLACAWCSWVGQSSRRATLVQHVDTAIRRILHGQVAKCFGEWLHSCTCAATDFDCVSRAIARWRSVRVTCCFILLRNHASCRMRLRAAFLHPKLTGAFRTWAFTCLVLKAAHSCLHNAIGAWMHHALRCALHTWLTFVVRHLECQHFLQRVIARWRSRSLVASWVSWHLASGYHRCAQKAYAVGQNHLRYCRMLQGWSLWLAMVTKHLAEMQKLHRCVLYAFCRDTAQAFATWRQSARSHHRSMCIVANALSCLRRDNVTLHFLHGVPVPHICISWCTRLAESLLIIQTIV